MFKKLVGIVFGEAQVHAKSSLQRLVGRYMGNGYVALRARLGGHGPNAVYVSDDWGCMEQDMLAPGNTALRRKIKLDEDDRAMLIERKPDHADRVGKGDEKFLRVLSAESHSRASARGRGGHRQRQLRRRAR